ncbi:MAG: hypothetical protein NXI27_25970 [Alphaproteobacteria bacterium]|nr:hypothetical protein [Alphaproteobacteria bacterium]
MASSAGLRKWPVAASGWAHLCASAAQTAMRVWMPRTEGEVWVLAERAPVIGMTEWEARTPALTTWAAGPLDTVRYRCPERVLVQGQSMVPSSRPVPGK